MMPMIDAWMNANILPPSGEPEGYRRIEYLFNRTSDLRRRGTTTEQYLEEMDAAGVAKGMLTMTMEDATLGGENKGTNEWIASMIEAHPDRFVASLYVDPRHGMEAVRAIESFKRDHDIRLVRMLGFKTQLTYDNAIYYPVYAKCAELGVPVGLNVGIPGPAVPGACQDPIHIEPVLAFFPELEVVMCHGGEPWQALCVKMMVKWRNLYYMTSAFSPKYIPAEIMTFLNSSRGTDRIMFASDYPMLTFERCRDEIENVLKFKNDDVKRAFLWDNAERLFFARGAAK